MNFTPTHTLTSAEFPNGVSVMEEKDQRGAKPTEVLVTLMNGTPVLAQRTMLRPITAAMDFTPTHVTVVGTPVQVLDEAGGTHLAYRTRTGVEAALPAGELFPLGSAEAEEILTPVINADRAKVVADTLSDRTYLAKRFLATEDARATLADAVIKALGMDLQWDVRKVLQQALAQAGEDLAAR